MRDETPAVESRIGGVNGGTRWFVLRDYCGGGVETRVLSLAYQAIRNEVFEPTAGTEYGLFDPLRQFVTLPIDVLSQMQR